MFGLTDRTWFWFGAAFYLAAFVLGTAALRRERSSTGLVYALIAIGFVFQNVGLYLRGIAVGGCPLGNTFEIFQFTAWSSMVLYLVIGATFRLSLLGYFTSMLAATLTVGSLAIPSWDVTRRVGAFGGNAWIEFHAALALFSYGVFALLALTSIMFLLRNHSLKHKHLTGSFAFLPSIRDLDLIGYRLLGAGVVLMSAAMVVGSVWWVRHPETVNASKLVTTVIIWLAYGAALTLRVTGRLIAQRLSWACIILFALALLSLGPVNSSRHALPSAARTSEVTK